MIIIETYLEEVAEERITLQSTDENQEVFAHLSQCKSYIIQRYCSQLSSLSFKNSDDFCL